MEIDLSKQEIEMLLSAIDSHQYWQLSDEKDRRDGFVVGESAKEDEHLAFQALANKLAGRHPKEKHA